MLTGIALVAWKLDAPKSTVSDRHWRAAKSMAAIVGIELKSLTAMALVAWKLDATKSTMSDRRWRAAKSMEVAGSS